MDFFGPMPVTRVPGRKELKCYLLASFVGELSGPLFSNRKMSLQEAGEGSCGQEGL